MLMYAYETQKSYKKSGVIWSFIYLYTQNLCANIYHCLLCASLPDAVLIS